MVSIRISSYVKPTNRTTLELKPTWQAMGIEATFTTNRTTLELKHAKKAEATALVDATNRTTLELKLGMYYHCNFNTFLPIAPHWN